MTAFLPRLRTAALALGMTVCGSAFAANNYFLQLTGIPGESTAKGHENWIEVTSFSWGVSNTASGGAGKASFNDLAWTQSVDSSTPKFFIALVTGKPIANAELDVVKPGDASGVFFKMTFANSLASSLQVGGGGSPTANAAITSGDVVTLSYRAQRSDGSLGPWITGEFDIPGATGPALFSGDPAVLNGLFLSGGNLSFDAGTIAVVPEPASAALLLAGLGLLAIRRLRG